MTKNEFLKNLERRLQGLPKEDIQKSLDFYGEILDDKIEEGLTEEEAVKALGDMEDIVGQILAEIPLAKIVGHKFKPKRALRVWEIVLLVLGFPLWFPLLLTAGVLLLSGVIIVWSLALIPYGVDLGLVVGGAVGAFLSLVCIFTGQLAVGLCILGGAIMLLGVSILLFFAANAIVKTLFKCSKKGVLFLKCKIVGKEE